MFTKKVERNADCGRTFALSASATAGGLLVGADAEGEGDGGGAHRKYEFLDASDPARTRWATIT